MINYTNILLTIDWEKRQFASLLIYEQDHNLISKFGRAPQSLDDLFYCAHEHTCSVPDEYGANTNPGVSYRDPAKSNRKAHRHPPKTRNPATHPYPHEPIRCFGR